MLNFQMLARLFVLKEERGERRREGKKKGGEELKAVRPRERREREMP